MAHIEEGGNGRQANADVNIVPFIDLMSVLVIFLLISAVWTQVSMIQIGSSIYGKKSSDEEVKPPPRAEIPFRLDIMATGHNVVIGRQVVNVPKVDNKYDLVRLQAELKKIKEIYPEKLDAVITMGDELAYVNLVTGMDALLQAGFPEISVATSGGE
jgi:biopolymer transport protein TolR